MGKFDSSQIWNLTKESLLERVSNEEILKFYIPGEGIKYKALCKLHNDTRPSLLVDLNRGTWLCPVCSKSGDGLEYIKERYKVNFWEAINIAANDFGLLKLDYTRIPSEVLGLPLKTPKNSISTIIRIKSKPWSQKDVLFWKQFNISKELAIRYNVYPISHYWVNQHCFTIKKGELAYAFYDQGKFQIYQPFASKDKKWFSNTGLMIYGYEQLPNSGDLLIITSSRKDSMTLTSLGYNAVSPNNEARKLPEKEFEDLNNRFDKIIIYFNNDYQGLQAAHYMSQELGLDFIFNPFEIEQKDPSDYCKYNSAGELDVLIKKLLNGI